MILQSVLFDKDKWTLQQAREWLENNNLKTNLDETEEYFRFRQVEPRPQYFYRTVG